VTFEIRGTTASRFKEKISLPDVVHALKEYADSLDLTSIHAKSFRASFWDREAQDALHGKTLHIKGTEFLLERFPPDSKQAPYFVPPPPITSTRFSAGPSDITPPRSPYKRARTRSPGQAEHRGDVPPTPEEIAPRTFPFTWPPPGPSANQLAETLQNLTTLLREVQETQKATDEAVKKIEQNAPKKKGQRNLEPKRQ
jgi:hypothetical protein